MTVDMRDYSVNANDTVPATVASSVLAWWTSNANEDHTIKITIPADGHLAVVDMFL